MSSIESVHMWGFFDAEGRPRQPDGAAPSDLSVYHHHRQIEANLTHHGGTVHNLRTTRSLDGLLVGTEFESPTHGNAARIWHIVRRPSDEWHRPKRATTQPHGTDRAPDTDRSEDA